MLTFIIGSQWKPVVRVLGKSLQVGYKVQQQKTQLTTASSTPTTCLLVICLNQNNKLKDAKMQSEGDG